jgi:hypothetical protein
VTTLLIIATAISAFRGRAAVRALGLSAFEPEKTAN